MTYFLIFKKTFKGETVGKLSLKKQTDEKTLGFNAHMRACWLYKLSSCVTCFSHFWVTQLHIHNSWIKSTCFHIQKLRSNGNRRYIYWF